METILVVEDESSLRENIQETLELNDYRILTAENGLHALQICETVIPDLVISDIMMPVMDGYKLLEECQKNPRISSVPFIFLTAKSGDSDLRKGMNLGADDYITKPFKVKDLLLAVETRLQKKKKVDIIINETAKTISQFVPHELRTPLVSIIGFTQLLLDEYDYINRDEVVDYLSKIRKAGSRLHRTIEKFLLYSDLSFNKVKPCREKQLWVIVEKEHIASFLNNTIQLYNRKGDLTIETENCKLAIGEDHFYIILDELIENALKFSSAGKNVKISGSAGNGFYRLDVVDFGIGISPENLEKIAPFVQLQREQAGQDGTGLGLAIVKTLVNLYGGKFEVESKEGKYSKFTVTFPIA